MTGSGGEADWRDLHVPCMVACRVACSNHRDGARGLHNIATFGSICIYTVNGSPKRYLYQENATKKR